MLARPNDEGVECRAVGALLDSLLRAFHRAAVLHGPGGYRWRRMKSRELEYDLPAELIAQHPMARRDESRLLVYERVSERVDERRFAELPDVLGDALTVVNDTRVVPARIPIERPRGEVLLLERLEENGTLGGAGAADAAAARGQPVRAGRTARAHGGGALALAAGR